MTSAGIAMINNYNNPLVFWGSAIAAGGLASYQIIKTYQVSKENNKRSPNQVPCNDCVSPCPLKDLKVDRSQPKAVQQQYAHEYLTENMPEMLPSSPEHRTEFGINGFKRYLRLIIGQGKDKGKVGINCDIKIS